MHFDVNAMEKMHNSTTFRYAGESSGSVMSIVMTDQALLIWQSDLAMTSGEVLVSCSVRIRDTGSQIHTNAVAFGRK